ncbi:unnamed protein product [Caenorhabditis bovis]|uniref:Uncharacterized protein n=1 Tax=Caenorhabditis bovis TaxID=2654633 RepID=A0A8S1EY02_9PELO|nr:unnamed protein product [Caenorhabditis bovis]
MHYESKGSSRNSASGSNNPCRGISPLTIIEIAPKPELNVSVFEARILKGYEDNQGHYYFDGHANGSDFMYLKVWSLKGDVICEYHLRVKSHLMPRISLPEEHEFMPCPYWCGVQLVFDGIGNPVMKEPAWTPTMIQKIIGDLKGIYSADVVITNSNIKEINFSKFELITFGYWHFENLTELEVVNFPDDIDVRYSMKVHTKNVPKLNADSRRRLYSLCMWDCDIEPAANEPPATKPAPPPRSPIHDFYYYDYVEKKFPPVYD